MREVEQGVSRTLGTYLPDRSLRRVGQAERPITFAAFLVLIVVLFADVITREVTGAGIIWARQIGVYANLLLTLVGIGIASAQGAHLRPRFADAWRPAIPRI